MNSLILEIIKPTESKKIEVAWLSVDTPTGNFIVGPNHAPLLSILSNFGNLSYKNKGGSVVNVKLTGGILKVYSNHAIILLES